MSFLHFLHERGLVNVDLFEIARKSTGGTDSYVCDLLLGTGDFCEEELARLKSEYYKIEYTDLTNFSKIDRIDYKDFESILALPFMAASDCVHIAVHDPGSLAVADKVGHYLAMYDETSTLRHTYYVATKSALKQKFREINRGQTNLVNGILHDAMQSAASDVHIIPLDKTVKIMLRIDGTLTDYRLLPIDEFEQLIISLKVLAKLDISETRRPQSGRFMKNNCDFRVSSHPTSKGESIVIRVLNKNKELISIGNIGFSDDQIMYLTEITSYSNGMIIFCGPTGSGKTTSIYSLLETIDKKSRNIMTLEDPVEYQIQNIRQTEIKRGVIDFADGIRSILRQDPDVIFIGEIRDEETAKMAVRASMTGHLVFTTIHSNDSFGAISRFRELSVPNSLIADNIIAIISQRLVKKVGQGRTIVSEILRIDKSLNDMISADENQQNLRAHAISALNFRTISDDYNAKCSANLLCNSDFQLGSS
ncbi:MAG: type II/IV secretion system protein [Holosporales bacterium]|nr:type II/IV secretion system protein [Holosporales bacterium]